LERGRGATHDATDRLRPLYGAGQASHRMHLLNERSQRSGAENPRTARAAQVAARAVEDAWPPQALTLAVLALGERRRDEGDGQSGKG